jgi:hypothetical protein
MIPQPRRTAATECGGVPAGDGEVRRFVELSVPLTGFGAYDLYGTGMGALYLEIARTQVGREQFAGFLDRWQDVLARGEGPSALSGVHREIARAVVYLWYTGFWPALAPAAHAELRRSEANKEVAASAESYPEGLVWRTFDGHPAGAKPPGFATWACEQESLPSPERIVGQLKASRGSDPVTPAPAYDPAAYGAGQVDDGVPLYLLSGPRVSRAVAPSEVSAADVQPAESLQAGE